MVYCVKYWITVKQETPDVKSFVVCGNSLSAPYLVKINTVKTALPVLENLLFSLHHLAHVMTANSCKQNPFPNVLLILCCWITYGLAEES